MNEQQPHRRDSATRSGPGPTGPGPRRRATAPTLILVRHGRTALNADGRLRGLLDPPLDTVGQAQVARLAEQLASYEVARVLSSPLRRATQTAHAIAAPHRQQVELDVRLLDRDYGRWAGQPTREVTARWGALDLAPGVEERRHVVARALDILHMHVPHAPVVLVTHDATLHAMLETLDPDRSAASIEPAAWFTVAPDARGELVLLDEGTPDPDIPPAAAGT